MRPSSFIQFTIFGIASLLPSSRLAFAAMATSNAGQNKERTGQIVQVEFPSVSSLPQMAVAQDISLPKFSPLSDSDVILPPGCENHKTVVKGNPAKAKTQIVAGWHNERSKCFKTDIVCMKGLYHSKNKKNPISKKKVAVLVEDHPHDKHIWCGEYGLDDISDDCRSWNIPGFNDPKTGELFKYTALKSYGSTQAVADAYNYVLEKPIRQRKRFALDLLEQHIKYYQSEIKKEENAHQKLFDKFQTTHPDVTIQDFSSKHFITALQYKFLISELEFLQKEINNGRTVKDVFDKFWQELHEINIIVHRFLADTEATLINPNKYLSRSIQEASQRADLVLVGSGSAHVDPEVASIAGFGAAPFMLFKDLDQFADKNPYAVLDCIDEEAMDSLERETRARSSVPSQRL